MAPLSENSTMKLGLVGVAISLVFAVGWWAAVLQTKVDTLITMTAANSVHVDALEREIGEIKSRLTALERKP